MTHEVQVSKIIETALTVSNLLGDMMDIYEHNTENGEELYDAMDALWFAIEDYKKAVARGEA